DRGDPPADRLDDRELPGAARRRDDGTAIDPDPADQPAVGDSQPVQVAFLVAEGDRLADQDGRAEQASFEAVLGPERLADIVERVDPAAGIGGDQRPAIEIDRADRGDILAPGRAAGGGIDAADPALVGAGAELSSHQYRLAEHV